MHLETDPAILSEVPRSESSLSRYRVRLRLERRSYESKRKT